MTAAVVLAGLLRDEDDRGQLLPGARAAVLRSCHLRQRPGAVTSGLAGLSITAGDDEWATVTIQHATMRAVTDVDH